MAELYGFLKARHILGAAEGESANFETWGCLQPKLLFIFTGYTNSVFSVGPLRLVKNAPRVEDRRSVYECSVLGARGLARPCGTAIEARLVPKSARSAWFVLTRAVQFILSYFPGTCGKQTMHHLKDASVKQLGCIKLFLL